MTHAPSKSALKNINATEGMYVAVGNISKVYRYQEGTWILVQYLTIHQACTFIGIPVGKFVWILKDLKIEESKFSVKQLKMIYKWWLRSEKKPVTIGEYTPSMLISLAWDLRYKLDGKIRLTDWKTSKGYPAVATVINHFGSWNNFMIASRLKINRKTKQQNHGTTV